MQTRQVLNDELDASTVEISSGEGTGGYTREWDRAPASPETELGVEDLTA